MRTFVCGQELFYVEPRAKIFLPKVKRHFAKRARENFPRSMDSRNIFGILRAGNGPQNDRRESSPF